jgi:hypothetical protein
MRGQCSVEGKERFFSRVDRVVLSVAANAVVQEAGRQVDVA